MNPTDSLAARDDRLGGQHAGLDGRVNTFDLEAVQKAGFAADEHAARWAWQGGALATQISIVNPGVKAFVFNTAPFFSGDPMQNDMNRLAISERGEFLRVLRRYKEAAAADVVVLNCSPSASAGAKHSIRKLADCLTWIAAYEDPAAYKVLAPNEIAKPEVECGDAAKVHPGVACGAGEACIHTVPPKPQKSAL